jgi:hypothetical protein
MIKLTRLNHVPLIVNADLIEHVEVTPDTMVALTNGPAQFDALSLESQRRDRGRSGRGRAPT